MPVAEQLPAAAHHPHPSGPPVGPYLLQPVLLRLSAAALALLISLFTGLFAAGYGIPVGVVLSAMLLALLLAEHLPGRLDARAREHVRTVEGDG
ncbi:hypothetical protein ACFWOI_49980, partial [Streptomyces sp. NPDC058424]